MCKKHHHTMLHYTNRPTPSQPEPGKNVAAPEFQPNPESTPFATTAMIKREGPRTALTIVAVKVRAGNGPELSTYGLLDTASTTSFCTVDLATKLRAKGENTELSLSTLSHKERPTATCAVPLIVTSTRGEEYQLKAFTTKQLPVNQSSIATETDVQKYEHLRELGLPQVEINEVTLLIGQDHHELLIPREVRTGADSEPYAIRTALGWTVAGRLQETNNGHSSCAFISTDPHDIQLESLWALEKEPYAVPISHKDKEVLEKWRSEQTRREEHFVLPIPFREGTKLPTQASREMALKRLQSLAKKLKKDPKLHFDYTEQMEKLTTDGHADLITQLPKEGQGFYLPHHGVVNPNKSKIRVVFDCAAKAQGKSLNEYVYSGPDVTNNLLAVLLRFREHPIALIADIAQMFYQVEVPPDQRAALSYLWWPKGDLSQPPATYQHKKHLFGGTWSPAACMTGLNFTIEQHGADYPPQVSSIAKRSFYVDDLLVSVSNTSEAIQLSEQLRDLLSKGGFHLTKWGSNHSEVIDAIPGEERAPAFVNIGEPSVERTLGVKWKPDDDCFIFHVSLPKKSDTKRGLLSVLSAVYDPIGVASPFILKARQVFRETCRRKCQWDDPIPSDLLPEWNSWKQQVSELTRLQLPRCLIHKQGILRLRHFADASEKAYAVVTYLTVEPEPGERPALATLVMAKVRLSPLKTETIPRLELQAAKLAAQQDEFIRREMTIDLAPSHFYSDSSIVLAYIKNEEKRFQTFVANRVAYIRERSQPAQWSHVPTRENPADHATRGLSPSELISTNWMTGPTWGDWAQPALPLLDDDPNVKKERAITCATSTEEERHVLDVLIKRHSDWYRLQTSVAWIVHAINVWRKRTQPRSWVGISEMRQARTLIVNREQERAWPDGIEDGKLQKLQPFHDKQGHLRVGGRLSNAPLPYNVKHPVILPRRSHVTTLVLRDAHVRTGHSGRRTTLAATQSEYYIIGGRQAAYSLVSSCIGCKKMHGPPVYQLMASLPSDRVTPGGPPFQHVGLDYWGPFEVKIGRRREKRWGCLITCLATRGVHLELVYSLETDSFLQAFQRFTARRGTPRLIRSDQARNFIKADKDIREEVKKWDMNKIQSHLNQHSIEWNFNPPYASHHGGIWERQIKTVRRVLTGLSHEQVLTDEATLTLLCLVENIVNRRPLTAVNTDENDFRAISPQDLIAPMPPTLDLPLDTPSNEMSRSRWRQLAHLASVFWKRWLTEYLPDLQRRSKWQKECRGLREGDLVLVVDTQLPRNAWPLARVLTTPTKDQRSVRVKTVNGIKHRPFSKLVFLEQDTEE